MYWENLVSITGLTKDSVETNMCILKGLICYGDIVDGKPKKYKRVVQKEQSVLDAAGKYFWIYRTELLPIKIIVDIPKNSVGELKYKRQITLYKEAAPAEPFDYDSMFWFCRLDRWVRKVWRKLWK